MSFRLLLNLRPYFNSAAQLLPGVVFVRRQIFALQPVIFLVALSLAGCAGITSVGSNNSGGAKPTAPSIVTQPASATVTAGQTASFSVSAIGTAPLSYQW